MKLRRLVGRLLNTQERYAEDDFPSVVLLLRNPEFPGPEELLRIARQAWGTDGPVELLGSRW